MSVAEGSLKVGAKVSTPDGDGKVTAVGDRYVSVDLDSKSKGQYEYRELNVKGKKED